MLNEQQIKHLVNDAIEKYGQEVRQLIYDEIKNHEHDGLDSQQVKYINLFGFSPSEIQAISATIATTGNTDIYVIAPISGALISIDFSGVDALAANDTNYITWTITNLGQDGAGTNVMLGAINDNTTKATGGVALSANTKRSLILSTALSVSEVVEGDRLLIRAAATGTLANTVTFPNYLLRFK